MLRRHVLFGAAALPLAGLAACSSSNSPTTPADVVTQAANIVSALDAMLGQFHAQYGSILDDATFAKIEGYIAAGKTVAAQLVAGMPAASGAPLVNQIVGYVTDALSVLTQPPLSTLIPPQFVQVISAAQFVLPLLVAFVQSYLPSAPTAKAMMPMGTPPADPKGVLAKWAAMDY